MSPRGAPFVLLAEGSIVISPLWRKPAVSAAIVSAAAVFPDREAMVSAGLAMRADEGGIVSIDDSPAVDSDSPLAKNLMITGTMIRSIINMRPRRSEEFMMGDLGWWRYQAGEE